MDQVPMQQPAATPKPTGTPTGTPSSSSGMSQKTILIIVIAVVVLGALGMFAKRFFYRNTAEFMAEQAIERATGGNVDVDFNGDDTVTYKGEEGSLQIGENVSLPSNWPSDVPVMSGAKISFAGSSNPADGEAGLSVMFTVPASVSEAANYYKTKLADEGWTLEGSYDMGSVTIISAKKGERTVGASIVGSEEGTSVTLSVQE